MEIKILGLFVGDFSHVSNIKLEPSEVCPYKNICDYNNTFEKCYGALRRNNEFICDLDKLRLMYRYQDGDIIW